MPGRGSKPLNRDFRDLLAEFNAQDVEYLVVGAHALAAHGHVRATKDLDVWVRPDPENARRVIKEEVRYAVARSHGSRFGEAGHRVSDWDTTSSR